MSQITLALKILQTFQSLYKNLVTVKNLFIPLPLLSFRLLIIKFAYKIKLYDELVQCMILNNTKKNT